MLRYFRIIGSWGSLTGIRFSESMGDDLYDNLIVGSGCEMVCTIRSQCRHWEEMASHNTEVSSTVKHG